MATFPLTRQLDAKDCGPACLRMLAKHHGKSYSLQKLRELSHISREGVSMLGISDAAESIGFRTVGVKIPFEKLAGEVPLPCIAHWKQRHFVVVYEIKGRSRKAEGRSRKAEGEGKKAEGKGEEDMGICLLPGPSPDF